MKYYSFIPICLGYFFLLTLSLATMEMEKIEQTESFEQFSYQRIARRNSLTINQPFQTTSRFTRLRTTTTSLYNCTKPIVLTVGTITVAATGYYLWKYGPLIELIANEIPEITSSLNEMRELTKILKLVLNACPQAQTLAKTSLTNLLRVCNCSTVLP